MLEQVMTTCCLVCLGFRDGVSQEGDELGGQGHHVPLLRLLLCSGPGPDLAVHINALPFHL